MNPGAERVAWLDREKAKRGVDEKTFTINKKEIWAFDCDGTIFDTTQYPYVGPLIPGARKVINFVHDCLGDTTILWTCRRGHDLELAKEHIAKWDIHIDYYNEHCPTMVGLFEDTRKVFAHHYIDDRMRPHGLSWPDMWVFVLNRYFDRFGTTHPSVDDDVYDYSESVEKAGK
jgi:hypothetical protein